MLDLQSKIIFENEKLILKAETDGNLIGLTSTLKGISETTVYVYPEDLEKVMDFLKEVKEVKEVKEIKEQNN